ncbi:MAG: hypothetical protein Q8Q14_01880 [Gemmatimonadales bacterium]|nr:hypothetical protein [Gemmatimonadales bacterium]
MIDLNEIELSDEDVERTMGRLALMHALALKRCDALGEALELAETEIARLQTARAPDASVSTGRDRWPAPHATSTGPAVAGIRASVEGGL